VRWLAARLVGTAVAAQVGQHEAEVRCEALGDAVPHRVRLREAVQQQQGRRIGAATAAREQRQLTHAVEGAGQAGEPVGRRIAHAIQQSGGRALAACGDAVECRFQVGHRAVDVLQLLEAEQADAEGLEVGRFVALQRHARGVCRPSAGRPCRCDAVVVGVADHHAGAWKPSAATLGKPRRTSSARTLRPSSICSARSFSKP
jgi:hypothetical protein